MKTVHENTMMVIMHDMEKKMENLEMTNHIDHDFAMMMIVHHQAAIDMSNQLLNSSNDTTLRQMAQKMVSAQTEEIAALKKWLQQHK